MKKGLVVVHDPHNLYQFIWYYCNRGREREWDALCLPNGYKGEYMHSYCEDARIFNDIFVFKDDYSTMSTSKKLSLFAKMFFYKMVGKRVKFCKRLLSYYVDIDKYDEIVVLCPTGIVNGACIALGGEKEIIILEDGLKDYSERPTKLNKGQINSSFSWQGYILSKLGYSSPGWFRLETEENCIKYSSQPNKMLYKGYREMRLLFDKHNTDMNNFNTVIERVYPAIKSIDFNSAEAIIFSHPFEDYVEDFEKYKERFEHYICDNFKSIIIKKHPREKIDYNLPGVKVQEVDNSIPAEAILPYIKKQSIVLGSLTSIMISLKAYGLGCIVLDYENLYEESIKAHSDYTFESLEEITVYCDKFVSGQYRIETL